MTNGPKNPPDYYRQLDIFSPNKFGKKEVHVIGVGATGSYVALLLAKMGVSNIHVWDDDKVVSHNIPNQVFGPEDEGRPKVEALADIIKKTAGVNITTHQEKVAGKTKLKGIVFLLVDKMGTRREIWEGAIKFNLKVDLMVETRMASDNSRVYAIRPNNPSDIRFWEQTLYDDEKVERSACTNHSIAPTVALTASLAAWKLIKHFNGEGYQRELIVSLRPTTIIAKE